MTFENLIGLMARYFVKAVYQHNCKKLSPSKLHMCTHYSNMTDVSYTHVARIATVAMECIVHSSNIASYYR